MSHPSAVATPASYADQLHLYAGAGLRLPVEDIITQFEANTGHKVTVEYGDPAKYSPVTNS